MAAEDHSARDLVVRPATSDELAMMLDWAAAEAWNPGLADHVPFLAADPEGFLIGYLDGEPVACISVVTYGNNYAFLGFYICRPEFRGKGLGRALWQAGMERFGNRTIGLDGVVDQQENYAKSGFALAHRNIRCGGVAKGGGIRDPGVVDLQSAPELIQTVIAYDQPFFPGPREEFLKAWMAPPHRTYVFLEDGAVRGVGTVRGCRSGHKIGPLFADSEEAAEALFQALTAKLTGEQVFLDVPETNKAAIRLTERHGLKPVFETARMYRGKAPSLPLDRTYGITTFELG